MATTEDVVENEELHNFAVRYDAKMRDLLMQLTDGEEHTTRLREETGLSRQNVHRRLDKLAEQGVIITEVKQPAEGGQERKHARFTEKGEQLVDDGLLDAITDTNQNVLGLQEQLDRVSRQLQEQLDSLPTENQVRNTADRRARRVREDLRGDIQNLQEEIEQLREETRKGRSQLRSTDGKLEDRVSAAEEQFNDLETTLKSVEHRTDRIAGRVEELEDGTRSRQLDDISEDVTRLCSQVGDLEERVETAINDAAKACKIARDTRKDVNEKLDEHQAMFDEYEKSLNNNTDRFKNRLIEFDRRIGEIEDSLQDATEIDDSMAEMESRLQDLRDRWLELSEDVEKEKRSGFFR